MNTIEIFIDESGEIKADGPAMNVTGLVVVSKGEKALEAFHEAFYRSASDSGVLAGMCDFLSPDTPSAPVAGFLRKRALRGKADEHQADILALIGHANEAALGAGVEIAAFSLCFPPNPPKPWRALTGWEDLLLDRSYVERLKDALEILLFETAWVRTRLNAHCQIALNLPTRFAASPVPAQPSIDDIEDILWKRWGIEANSRSRGKIKACSLSPGDGAEILTSMLNRRSSPLARNVRILAARCVRLMDWETWDEYLQSGKSPEAWFRRSLPPKQVHYLADLLANAVYQEARGAAVSQSGLVTSWFENGYHLNAGVVDPWIQASRAFANGDRIGALRTLRKLDASQLKSREADFFRRNCSRWFPEMGGEVLRTLFNDAQQQRNRPNREATNPTDHSPGKSRPSAPPQKLQGKVGGGFLNPSHSATFASLSGQASAARPILPVSWRVMLEVPGHWTPSSFMEFIKLRPELPEPVQIRNYPGTNTVEFVLELRSAEEVRTWVSPNVIADEFPATVQDVTMPREHRLPRGPDAASHGPD